MADPELNEVLGLEDLLTPERAEELKALSPGIAWALDSLAISFREELGKLDDAAREAFFRLTLDYGKYLERFLKLAHREISPEEEEARQAKMENLRNLNLFNQLNEFDLSQIAGAFNQRDLAQGEVLVNEGDPGTAVYFLIKGQVGIFTGGNQVAVRGAGNLFGEMSCLTNTPASATLIAVTHCEMLVISKEDFEEYVLRLPEIVPQFARMGVSRLGDITHRLSEVLSHMPDALLKLDFQGMITGDVSSKCFQYLDREVLTGEKFSSLIFKDHSQQREEWDRCYEELLDDEALLDNPEACPIPRETVFRLQSGDERHYKINLFPTHLQGQLSGYDVAISDFTERKQIEEERKRMEKALINVVHKYMSFKLAGEVYGIEIETAREILEKAQLTKVPNAPAYLKGVFNLRGQIIPSVDLRVLLNLPPDETDSERALIIVEVEHEGAKRPVGVVVDSVTDILDIPDREVEPTPAAGLFSNVNFIQGVAKVDGQARLLLDVEKLLTENERRHVHKVAAAIESRIAQKTGSAG